MPSVQDAVSADVSGYVPVDKDMSPKGPSVPAPSQNLQPGFSVYQRCPLPPIWTTPPDSLRQFYRNSSVPQRRLFTPSLTT